MTSIYRLYARVREKAMSDECLFVKIDVGKYKKAIADCLT